MFEGNNMYFYEKPRILRIIDWAKNNQVKIIGVFANTGAKYDRFRGRQATDTIERIIDMIAPECDMLIVSAENNQDDKFTNIAEINSIPLAISPENIYLIPLMQTIFEQS